MKQSGEADKVKAIYAVRDAAEEKAHAEHDLRAEPSPEHRDALLDAQMALEAKTQDAIEVCHECGQAHKAGENHAKIIERNENVVGVDFRAQDKRRV